MHAPALAGCVVYSTLVKRRILKETLLRRSDNFPVPGSTEANATTDSQDVALGLCSVVSAIVQLVGRRYIDPGSGSFAIQIIIAAVLGGVLTARLWLRHLFWRVLGLVRRKKTEEQPTGEEADR